MFDQFDKLNASQEKQDVYDPSANLMEPQLYSDLRTAGGTSSGDYLKVKRGYPKAATLREEAEKGVGYHREQADKHDRAVAFLRENPAFDEFVRLVRAGVIQF